MDYLPGLIERFRAYRREHFAGHDEWFDDKHTSTTPPVFRKEYAEHNVLTREGAGKVKDDEVISLIPEKARHRWFGSMASSQALAQSVFGNLIAYRELDLLRGLKGDDGKPIFVRDEGVAHCALEYGVHYLGEPRATNVDVIFFGNRRVAVECKLREEDIGTCSRPRLGPKDDNYERDYCDGRYTRQRNRKHRCSLTETGVKYWEYVPMLFDWPADADHDPCPLWKTYQLVRNILAACVGEDSILRVDCGHAVLLYDARNPAFQDDGDGRKAYEAVKRGLKADYKGLLQKCTWQEVTDKLRADDGTSWLAAALKEKYGF